MLQYKKIFFCFVSEFSLEARMSDDQEREVEGGGVDEDRVVEGEGSHQEVKDIEVKVGELQDDEEETDWNQSVFYIYGYYERLDKKYGEMARCNMCTKKNDPQPGAKVQPKGIIHTKQSNTQGCRSHLNAHHKKLAADFVKNEAYVKTKRDKLQKEKEAKKRRAPIDLHEGTKKQAKLGGRDGKLSVDLPPEDLGVQKLWDDAMSDFLAETQTSFRSMAGPAFRNLIEVINKKSRCKIKVKERRTLSKLVSSRAEDTLQQVGSPSRSCSLCSA